MFPKNHNAEHDESNVHRSIYSPDLLLLQTNLFKLIDHLSDTIFDVISSSRFHSIWHLPDKNR